MNLQESGQMYLETILVLSGKLPIVRAIDVAEDIGYSKPSVSRAVGVLREGGFITVNPDGAILLTAMGREVAEKIYQRHAILTRFLISLGVAPDIAAEDACRIEHHISDASVEAIRRHAEEHTKNQH